MKFANIALLWLITFPTISNAADYNIHLDDTAQYTTINGLELNQDEIPYELGEAGLAKLYQQFEQHFGDYIGEQPKKTLDYAFVMGKKSSYTTFKLLFQYFLAMDEGLDVSQFERFGLFRKGEIGYRIPIKDQPHLASPTTVFRFAETKPIFLEKILLAKGFRQEDINIIQQYTKPDNYKYQKELNTYYIRAAKLPELKNQLKLKHLYSKTK